MDSKAAMLDLARRGGGDFLPLFAPLMRSVACQIEAITPLEMVSDPTRLAKGIGELRRAAGLDALVTATPCAMEAQAFGAEVDLVQWPPRIVGPGTTRADADADFDDLFARSPLLAAAIEATERLAPETSAEVAIVAALTGPATLLCQLFGNGDHSEDQRDFVAAAAAALARRFGQAGADAIVFVEDVGGVVDWTNLYGTVGNTAKFLKKPLVIAGPVEEGDWPRLAVSASLVSVVSANPDSWEEPARACGERFVTTQGEVSAGVPLGTLLDRLAVLREALGI